MSTQYTEEKVRELQDCANEFIELVNEYLAARRNDDYRFKYVALGEEETSFDIYGDTIAIQWTETDRCGDDEYLQVEFALSDLWGLDWKERVKQEKKEQRLEAKRKEAAREKAEQEYREQRERIELKRLQEKYGK